MTDHWSDCATNSEPAFPAGQCDCGGYPPKEVPMKFRKKPVVIEAVQAVEGQMSTLPRVYRDGDRQAWVIRTLEGVMEVKPGDWIIKGVAGELYPCKPEIFDATYEPAE